MLKVDQLVDIKALHREGHSIRALADLTGLSRNTIRKVLRGQHPGKRHYTQRPGKLAPFETYLRQRCADYPLSAVRLLEEIRPMGYTGSIDTLRRFLAGLHADQHARSKLTVRFETPPGRQAQADWTYCGRLIHADDRPTPVYAFACVLGYSRMLFVRFTTSMRLPMLIACHQQAFAFFGGWPQTILYDNMKQIRVGPGQLNAQFLDFANYHGFTPKTHQPYRARTKGKVERIVDYVKDNFLLGRTFTDLDDLNSQGQKWLDQTANVRVHGTTGRRPVDLFEAEKACLTPVSSQPVYRYVETVQRTANWEGMVHYQGSRYSVPPGCCGQKVQVGAGGGQVVVRLGDTIVAEHRQASVPGQCIVNKTHLEELWKITCDQVKPAQQGLWRQAEADVACVPLATFEEVLS